MKFEEYIKKKLVRKTTIDKQLIKSLIQTAESDLIFFKESKITENSARKIVSNYYDILREILEAIANKDGYKFYSHEAFTNYLKELKSEISIANKFDRFRIIRNNINYYGLEITVEEAEEYKKDLLEIINTLKKKYLKEAKNE
jgi:hypothetical protein